MPITKCDGRWNFSPVDADNGIPAHRQVREGILAQLEGTGQRPGRLPTERELCTSFGVSRFTVRQAVGELVRAGLLYRVQGSGTFVRTRAVVERISWSGYLDPFVSSPPAASVQIQELTEMSAGTEVGGRLGVPSDDPVLYLRRMRLLDGRPLAVDHRYLPWAVGRRLTSAQASSSSLSDFLANVLGIELGSGDMEIYMDFADEADAARLGLTQSRQVLVRQLDLPSRSGQMLMVGRSLYRPELARLHFTVAN